MRKSGIRLTLLLLLSVCCLASCVRISQVPIVVIQFPVNGSTHLLGADISFVGSATDARDGALTGASLVWASNLDGEIGTGTSFVKDDLSLGTHTITLTATNSQAVTGTFSIAVTISDNASPTVSITAPADGATFARGEPITLQGQGTDAEDGSLTGGSLVWSSSIDGIIGSGASIIKTTLAEGTHVITLTATDSEGSTGSDTVTIYVQGELTDTCYVYSIPDDGGTFALEIPQAEQTILYTLVVSWEGPTIGANSPGFSWPVTFTQASDGTWIAGPAVAIGGILISDGLGTNGDATAEDIIGDAVASSGNYFALHDDLSGVETEADWWTFELDNSNVGDKFSNVKLYVFPAASIELQRIENLVGL